MSFAKTLVTGILLAACSQGLHAQIIPAAGQGAKSAPPAAAMLSPGPPKGVTANAALRPPAAGTAKTSAPGGPATASQLASAKPPQSAAKPAAKTGAKTMQPGGAARTAQATAEGQRKVSRRDPFESLVSRQQAAALAAKNLPPGKAGLQISTLRLDGIVQAPNGMIAVVSNPQARTYFLREGDQLYDGRVEKIAMDGVAFDEVGKDAFGKPVERQVTKKIYSSAGEQQ